MTALDNLDQIVFASNLKTDTYGSPINHMINQIEEVFSECSVDDWDGYGARAVSQKTKWSGTTFIKYLPSGIPNPEFSADPDGHLSFEWYKDPRKIVTVSISPDDILYYAALVGDEKANGSAYLPDGLPEELLDLIHKVVSE